LNVLLADESWRVRFTLADKLPEFLNMMAINSQVKNWFIDTIVKMLDDPEMEIRNALCNRIELISEKLAKEETFEKFLKKLKQFDDAPQFLKETFAKNILKICPYINKKLVQEYIIPSFISAIQQQNDTIRLAILKNVDKLNEVITLDHFNQHILPTLFSISENKGWRTRIQVTECLPFIAKIVNKELFLKNLLSISLKWMSDEVFAIREEGCKVLKKLFDYFSCEEFDKRLVEKLVEMKNETNYLRRGIVLTLIKEFTIDQNYADLVEQSYFPFVSAMAKDKVGNIRMACAVLLRMMLKFLKSPNNINEAKYILEELKKDTDHDVMNGLMDDLVNNN